MNSGSAATTETMQPSSFPNPAYLQRPLYLDGHASTPCDEEVVEAMLPWLRQSYGNPASLHRYGVEADRAVEVARASAARLIGARPSEVHFTSGATESCNLAVKGLVQSRAVVVATEHRAVLAACEAVARRGAKLDIVPVGPSGLVDLDRLRDLVFTGERPDLIAVMAANNETGVLQPLSEVAAVSEAAVAPLLVDASQMLGWLPIDVHDIPVDLLVWSAHKIHGPKGIGALYVRRNGKAQHMSALHHGGGQERGLRSGTLNVPAIVGFGVACELAGAVRQARTTKTAEVRDHLLGLLKQGIPDLHVHGSMERRLPNNLCIAVPGVEADALLQMLPDLALSTGSACHAGTQEPSYVLRAMGIPDDLAWSSFRVGLLHNSTRDQAEYAAARISWAVSTMRERISQQLLARRSETATGPVAL